MSGVLGLGKVTREVFNRCVLPFIPTEKAIELDGATISLKGNTVISHSPSIGVPIDALGFFAFHYSASNVASKFGKPRHLVLGIYLPLKSTENDLKIIAKTLGEEARNYGVTVTAGQTATYYGIEIPFLTTTCIGEAIRFPGRLKAGDTVLLVGEVGGEAVWLDMLSRGVDTDIWKSLSPLSAILSLQDIEGIKILHDVSEGGVKGALYEVVLNCRIGLNVSSETVKPYLGAETLQGDVFRAPTYGTFLVILDNMAVDDVYSRCKEQGVSCSTIGEVTLNKELVFDSEFIREQKRTLLDEVYGRFNKKN